MRPGGRRRLLVGAAAVGLQAPLAGIGMATACAATAAANPLRFGYATVTDSAAVFVAAEEGLFRRRGLAVVFEHVPGVVAIPAALHAGAIQVGALTPPVLLQAAQAGDDLLVVSGGGTTDGTSTASALVGRAGSSIRRAADLVGRRVGVPGLEAFPHVCLRAWLATAGVDWRAVTFVDAPYPKQADLLVRGAIDAVVSVEPFLGRIIASGAGHVVSYYASFLPAGSHTALHTARRDWAGRHGSSVRAFREAVIDAAALIRQPRADARVRAAINRQLALPAEVLAQVPIPPPGPSVSARQLEYWVRVLVGQGMLAGPVDVGRLVAR